MQASGMQQQSPREAEELLRLDLIDTERQTPLLFWGPPGIGKTAFCRSAALKAGIRADRFFAWVCSLIEAPDLGGFTWMQQDWEYAKKIPAGELAEVILGEAVPTCVLMDDLGQASEDVLKAAMSLLHVKGGRLPDHVRICAASNSREDRAGVTKMLSPVTGRVTQVFVRPPTPHEFSVTAADIGMSPNTIAFLRWSAVINPNSGSMASAVFPDTLPVDGSAFPSPRGWESVSRRELSTVTRTDEQLMILAAGDVGLPLASEYMAFKKLYSDVVFVEQVLLSPDTAPIPDEGAALCGLMAGLAGHAGTNKARPGPVMTYLARLAGEGKAPYVGYALKAISRVNPTFLTASDAGQQLLARDDISKIVYGPGVEV